VINHSRADEIVQKAGIFMQFFILMFIIFGILILVFPVKIDRIQKKVFRTFRLISEVKANTALTPGNIIAIRIIGLIFISLSIFAFFSMHLQIGKINRGLKPVGADTALHQTVTRIVQPMADDHVGLVVCTIADDKHDITGFGRINLKAEQSPDGDTIFEIGSITKAFTGILLANMIAQNNLALNTTVLSLLPSRLNEPDAQKKSVTLQHLVTHTSGLKRMPANLLSLPKIWASIRAGDYYRGTTEEDVYDTILKKKLRHNPGEYFAYSNAGFGLLGLILSEQSGDNYHNLVKTVITDNLGLENTGVQLNKKQLSGLATGYRSFFRIGPFYLAQRSEYWNFPDCMAAAGGIRSTAKDMQVFLAANMGKTSSSLVPIMKQSHAVLFKDDDVQIGMGWFHDQLPDSGKTIITHGGETGGFTGFLGFTEDSRFGVVILSNSTNQVDEIGYMILEALVKEY